MRVSTHFRCLGKPGTQSLASRDRRHTRKSAPQCRECKAKKGGRYIGRTAGGLHSRLHAVCDGNGRWVRIALTEGQRNDDDGAHFLLADPHVAKPLLADTAYDADWFGATLAKRKSGRVSRQVPNAVIQQYTMSGCINSDTRLKTCSGT